MRRVKKKEYENLSDSNIQKVIDLLNDTPPISKKDACGMLNIAYNTTRLQRIIDDYEDKKSYRELRKAKNRGKAATDSEITEAVELFLSGDSIAAIAKGLYRSAGFVRGIIERVGVPQKTDAKIDFLPDECCAEDFDEGEIVWAARYSAPAIVRHEVSVDYQAERAGYSDVNYEKKYGSKCYSIYVMEKIRQDQEMYIEAMTGGFNAFCLAYDLGKLTHLKKYGVDLSRI
jgi:hypothetical protein